MADEKKKKKEKGLLDSVREKYESAAKAGYLGARAKVTVEEGEKKKKKKSNGFYD
jgi:hypothetical protein